MQKTDTKGRKKIVFKRRLHALLDDDVLKVVNACAQSAEWSSKKEAINALIRHGGAKFAPQVPLRLTPFEQLALTPKRPRKAKAMPA